jgi:hypothetical protein
MRGLACVNESDLRAFLLGELPERVGRAVSDHLETCVECEEAARRLDALTDPVIRSLRRVFCAAADSSGPGPLVDTDDGDSAPSGEPASQEDAELPRRVAGYTILGVYYPPYHSKYNPIERCWSSLEKKWNGVLLNCWEVILACASRMTWPGRHPVVERLLGSYAKKVRVPEEEMPIYNARLERSTTLPKYDITIKPITPRGR